jgi:hypothetical protein
MVMRTGQRHAWQKWLVLLALVCVVGLYSARVTHIFRTTHDSLIFKKVKSENESSAVLAPLPPTPVARVRAAAYYRWHTPDSYFLPYSRHLTPQSRAPPPSPPDIP